MKPLNFIPIKMSCVFIEMVGQFMHTGLFAQLNHYVFISIFHPAFIQGHIDNLFRYCNLMTPFDLHLNCTRILFFSTELLTWILQAVQHGRSFATFMDIRNHGLNKGLELCGTINLIYAVIDPSSLNLLG